MWKWMTMSGRDCWGCFVAPAEFSPNRFFKFSVEFDAKICIAPEKIIRPRITLVPKKNNRMNVLCWFSTLDLEMKLKSLEYIWKKIENSDSKIWITFEIRQFLSKNYDHYKIDILKEQMLTTFVILSKIEITQNQTRCETYQSFVRGPYFPVLGLVFLVGIKNWKNRIFVTLGWEILILKILNLLRPRIIWHPSARDSRIDMISTSTKAYRCMQRVFLVFVFSPNMELEIWGDWIILSPLVKSGWDMSPRPPRIDALDH